MNTARRVVLSVCLLLGAALTAYPPWLETQIPVQEEGWLELRPVPSSTAWGYAPLWAAPAARYYDDFGYTFRVTYRIDLARLAAGWAGLAWLTAGAGVGGGGRGEWAGPPPLLRDPRHDRHYPAASLEIAGWWGAVGGSVGWGPARG